MYLDYPTIYQLGAVAASAIAVKISTQPAPRPLDLICNTVVLISAAIMFTELGLMLAGTIPPVIQDAKPIVREVYLNQHRRFGK